MAARTDGQIFSQSLNNTQYQCFYPIHLSGYDLGLRTTAYIIDTKPKKHTSGATLIRRALKMSGSKAVSVEPGPVISKNPTITMNIPTASKMKFILSNAKFLLSIYLSFFTIHYILYSSPAVILRNLFTEIHEQMAVMMMPKSITAAAVMANSRQVMMFRMLGS